MIPPEGDRRKGIRTQETKFHMEDAPRLIDQSFSEFVDTFLENAEIIYKTLEAENHQHQYQLIGNTISVAIRRMTYKKGVVEDNEHIKNYGQNETVEFAQGDQSKDESTEKCGCKDSEKKAQQGSEENSQGSEEPEEIKCPVCGNPLDDNGFCPDLGNINCFYHKKKK